MFELRPYQQELKNKVYNAWQQGHRNVLAQMPTGASKTVFVSDVIREHRGAGCMIAHRQELVLQLSLAMASQNIHHNLIASKATVKFIATIHNIKFGKSFFHPQAPFACAGVDTLTKRDLGYWANQVTMWGQDEAHHVLANNKWGKAAALFPNAIGLGLTATAGRADGKGLGRQAHGLFDVLIQGPTMRELINQGNLTDYRIFAPPASMDLTDVNVSKSTGDYNQHQLRNASHKSQIVGDVVKHYLRIAPGLMGITFAVDVETSTEIAAQYNAAGVPAGVVSAKTPEHLRNELIERFKRRELLQLVNVDLFGEGFDLPALEVVSMARPTKSTSLYMQQFGRVLRPIKGKSHGIVIDHVGNVQHHGLPDAHREWSLEAKDRGQRNQVAEDVIPVTACTSCMSIYERIYKACPFCGAVPIPAERSKPEHVDGDLHELSPEVLEQMRGEVLAARETPENMKARLEGGGLTQIAVNSQVKMQREKHELLDELVTSMNYWGAIKEANGLTRADAYRAFFHRFGVDVLSAQTLPKKDIVELTGKIQGDYAEFI